MTETDYHVSTEQGQHGMKRSASCFTLDRRKYSVTTFVGEGASQWVDLCASPGAPLWARSKSKFPGSLDQERQATVFNALKQSPHEAFVVQKTREAGGDRLLAPFLPGMSFDNALSRVSLLSQKLACVCAVLERLKRLHGSAKRVHLDVRSDNTLLDFDGVKIVASLVDFQFTQSVGEEAQKKNVPEKLYALLVDQERGHQVRYNCLRKSLNEAEEARRQANFGHSPCRPGWLWYAPEILAAGQSKEQKAGYFEASPAQDVFSFAVMLLECIRKEIVLLDPDARELLARAQSIDVRTRPSADELSTFFLSQLERAKQSEIAEINEIRQSLPEDCLADPFFRELLLTWSAIDHQTITRLVSLHQAGGARRIQVYAMLSHAQAFDQIKTDLRLEGEQLDDKRYNAMLVLWRLNMPVDFDFLKSVFVTSADWPLVTHLHKLNCLVTGPNGYWFKKNRDVARALHFMLYDQYPAVQQDAFWLFLIELFKKPMPLKDRQMSLRGRQMSLRDRQIVLLRHINEDPDALAKKFSCADLSNDFKKRLQFALKLAYLLTVLKLRSTKSDATTVFLTGLSNQFDLIDSAFNLVRISMERFPEEEEVEIKVRLGAHREDLRTALSVSMKDFFNKLLARARGQAGSAMATITDIEDLVSPVCVPLIKYLSGETLGKFMAWFTQIHRAIFAGETAYFKEIEEPVRAFFNAGSAERADSFKKVIRLSEKDNTSRAHEALRLAILFPGHSLEVVNQIYISALRNPGFFGQSQLRPNLFAHGRRQSMEDVRTAMFKQPVNQSDINKASPDSRLGKILNALPSI
jgi:hypothetical protein